MTPADVLQSALDSAGPQAAHIERLWWLMFWVTSGVFVIVIGLLAVAVVRGRRAARRAPDDGLPTRDALRAHEDRTNPMLTRAVALALGATVAILFVLLVASVWTGRTVGALGAASAVTVNVTGHQFWWEIEYEDATPSRRVTTANEIHIPVGRPVVLKVTSRDVIHSFWVPNLHGKRDLIPGYTTAIWLQADRPSVYRGQCAEFCGRQHAHMAFDVVAEPDAQFERWLDAQRQTAPPPHDPAAERGQRVFLKSQCALCHTVRGTPAQGRVGPELTHVASRGKIAAGTLPNTSGHLAGWVIDAQQIKPGSQMPPNHLGSDDLQALLVYLEALK